MIIFPTLPLLAQEAVRTGTYVLLSEEPIVGVRSDENIVPKAKVLIQDCIAV